MSRKTTWELENFHLLINSIPSVAANGSAYATDALNIKVDEDGHARQRMLTKDEILTDGKVSGIVATRDHIFYLIQDILWVRDIDDPGTNRVLGKITGASGKLSLIRSYRDYLIITSEGDDQGFWINLRDKGALSIHKLGFDPPNYGPSVIPAQGLAVTLSLESQYYYRYTTVRKFTGESWNVDIDKERNVLFDGMESNPSPATLLNFGNFDEIPDPLSARIAITHDPDPQATGVYVYRSQQMLPFQDEADAQYRRIAYVPKGATFFTDFMADDRQSGIREGITDNLKWANQELMRMDNNRLPASVSQITFFNGRIFGATDRSLRYSDVRYGNPTPWAFPEVNEINVDGEVDFSTRYYRRLIFGGRDGLWSLSGTSRYNFVVGEIAGVGPIHGHALGQLDKGVGFINGNGFFVCDDTQAIRISSPELDLFFEGKVIVDGSVTKLPNSESLWAVTTFDGRTYQDFQFHLLPNKIPQKDTWARWTGANVKQSAIAFYDAGAIWSVDGESRWVDSYDEYWIAVDNREAVAHILYVDGDTNIKEILWYDKTAVNETLKWHWESGELLWRAQNMGTYKKHFRSIVVTGNAENINIQHSVDGEVWKGQITSLQEQKKIMINRRGRSIAIKIGGTGKLDLRGIKVFADIFVRSDR